MIPYFLIALAISVVLNVVQLHHAGTLQSRIGEEKQAAVEAHSAATQCSAQVDNLRKQADVLAKEAEASRLRAQRLASTHRARADRILATPPATPGDVCKSALARLNSWWEQHK